MDDHAKSVLILWSPLQNTASRHFGLLQYLSMLNLVEMVSLLAGTVSLSESYLFSMQIYTRLSHAFFNTVLVIETIIWQFFKIGSSQLWNNALKI